jgi:hypothetical protein
VRFPKSLTAPKSANLTSTRSRGLWLTWRAWVTRSVTSVSQVADNSGGCRWRCRQTSADFRFIAAGQHRNDVRSANIWQHPHTARYRPRMRGFDSRHRLHEFAGQSFIRNSCPAAESFLGRRSTVSSLDTEPDLVTGLRVSTEARSVHEATQRRRAQLHQTAKALCRQALGRSRVSSARRCHCDASARSMRRQSR